MGHPYQKTQDVVADVHDVLETLLMQTERRSNMWSRMAEPADAQLDRLMTRNLRRALTLSHSFCLFARNAPAPGMTSPMRDAEKFFHDIAPVFNEMASLAMHAMQDHAVSPLHEKIVQANAFVLDQQMQRIKNAMAFDILRSEKTAPHEDGSSGLDVTKISRDCVTNMLAGQAYTQAFYQEMMKGMLKSAFSLMTPPKPRPDHLKLVIDNTKNPFFFDLN